MKSQLVLIFFGFIFLNFSCQKKTVAEMTTVTFRMPVFSTVHQRSASAPTTIDEVNCFAVMVTGPEPFMNRTSCPVTDEYNANLGTKTVGGIRGLVPAGGILSLPVAAGIKRRFILLGLKADPVTACMDFFNPYLSFDFISKPFIIGESSDVDLPPGAEVNVPIDIPDSGTPFTNMSQRLGDCSGPDSPTDRNKIVPTKTRITKNSFPMRNFTYGGCDQIAIEFVDDYGRNGLTQSSFNLSIARKELPNGTSFVQTGLYSDSSCSSSLGTQFNIPAFVRSFPVYVSTAFSPGVVSALQFQLTPGASSPFAALTTLDFPLRSATDGTLDILGVRRVAPDMCYNMLASFKTADKNTYSGDGYTVQLPNIEGALYDGQNCNTASLGNGATQSLSTAGPKFNFSLRYTQDSVATTHFSLTPVASSITSSFSATQSIIVVGGSHNPTFLNPELPEIPGSPGCYGPFQALIENERGGALVTNGSLSVGFLSGAPSQLGIYNNELCNQTYSAVFTSDYRRIFYVGVSGTAISPGTTVTLKAHGQIKHPDTLSMANPQVVSLTTYRSITF